MKMYYLAVVAPSFINFPVARYKQVMADQFGAVAAQKSPAHITIIPPFWMDEENEVHLVAALQEFGKSIQQFEIETKDFDTFGNRTIFIDVVPSAFLSDLRKEAFNFFEGSFPVKNDGRAFHPHITIATRDLHKAAFAEAWEIFKTKPFEEKFNADALSLLKHNGRNWDVIARGDFSPSGAKE